MFEYFSNGLARDLAGLNGKGAQSCAKSTVKFVEDKFYNNEIIVEGDGAMKWKSNGNYLPHECAEAIAYIRHDNTTTPAQRRMIFNASVEATDEKRKAQEEESLKAYIEARKNHVVSEEERYEMECAFGKGTTVVDVLTGEAVKL